MTSLAHQVSDKLRGEHLLRTGQRLILAVSGGLDSMVLLHVISELVPVWRLRLSVFHFDHQLRGDESSADAEFVRRAAATAGLTFHFGTARVAHLASEKRISIEMAARQARHESLGRVATRTGVHVAATGHHADDQVELFFLRLLRGSGTEALCGMKACSVSPVEPLLTLIRPLLDFTRAELRDYAKEQGVQFREDSTNASPDYLRNRVRHELLPLLLKDFSASTPRKVLNLMETAGAEGEVVRLIAEAWLAREGIHSEAASHGANHLIEMGKPYDSLPRAVQRQIVLRQLLRLGVPPSFDLVEQLRLRADSPISMARGMILREKGGRLRLDPSEAEPDFKMDELEIAIADGVGQVRFETLMVHWRIQANEPTVALDRCPGQEVFDADAVGSTVRLRHWRPGDRYQPIGMKQEVKVQDYFTNEKVLRKRRHELILGCTNRDEVFWIEGMRISERFKLTPLSKRRLHWSWSRL